MPPIKPYRALDNFHVSGIDTLIPFLKTVIADPEYRSGAVNTRWLEKKLDECLFGRHRNCSRSQMSEQLAQTQSQVHMRSRQDDCRFDWLRNTASKAKLSYGSSVPAQWIST